jgi:hypothetical protein
MSLAFLFTGALLIKVFVVLLPFLLLVMYTKLVDGREKNKEIIKMKILDFSFHVSSTPHHFLVL